MSKADDAQALFDAGCNCAQAVLAAFGPDHGLDRATCMKLAAPLGGGIARAGATCGALTGAMLALGLIHAPVDASAEAKEAVYAEARELMRRFAAENGSTLCRELLGCDPGTPEGRAYAREHNLHADRCAGLVRWAADYLARPAPTDPSPAAR